MDLELDRKILLTSVDQKSLYAWCIQEFGENGDKIGQDQIPWAWSNYFVATSLNYQVHLRGETKNLHRVRHADADGPPKISTKNNQINISEEESITATLQSENDATSYSMFGTGREIKDIALTIYRETKQTKESCFAWGCPSYEYELDFRNEVQPDTIQFNLFLKPDKFNKILDLIKANNINKLIFIPGGVKGFYSAWSPMISTSNIKVLCRDSDHKVEVDKKCKLTAAQQKNIPRLDEVLEFRLTILQNQNRNLINLKSNDDDYTELYETVPEQNNFDKNLVMQLQKLAHHLKQTLLVIVILLVLILIFK
jgi:hypothetical protein